MNLIAGERERGRRRAAARRRRRCALALPAARSPARHRRHARQRAARAARAPATSRCRAQVELAEISGSDTFVHVDTPIGELVAQLTGVHAFDARRAGHAVPRPAPGLRVRRGRRPAGRAGRRTGGTDMARIDLDLAHAYRPNPTSDDDYALLPLKMSFARRRRLRAARPVGLRQDDAAQHHLGPRQAVAGQRAVRRRRRDRADAAAAQHRPGVPVPGHLRHDDRGREPRLPAAQPRRAAERDHAARAARSPRCSS